MLTNEERETVFSMTADDHGTFTVFSDDPYWMRRLDKLAEFVRVVGEGKEYRLKAEQIRLRTGKRRMSEAQRAQLADRMRAARFATGIASAK